MLREGEIFEGLRVLQREGKIKSFGVSVETNEEAMIMPGRRNSSRHFQYLQSFRQKPLEFFDVAKSERGGLIVRLPLASGRYREIY